MPIFSYLAKDARARQIRGTIAAETENEARETLARKGYSVEQLSAGRITPSAPRKKSPRKITNALAIIAGTAAVTLGAVFLVKGTNPGGKNDNLTPHNTEAQTNQTEKVGGEITNENSPNPQTDSEKSAARDETLGTVDNPIDLAKLGGTLRKRNRNEARTDAEIRARDARRAKLLARPHDPRYEEGTGIYTNINGVFTYISPVKKKTAADLPIFTNKFETFLYAYSTPGASVPPSIFAGNITKADVEAALATDVFVYDDDPPEVIDRKEEVALMKEEMREWLANGGSIKDFINGVIERQNQESLILAN